MNPLDLRPRVAFNGPAMAGRIPAVAEYGFSMSFATLGAAAAAGLVVAFLIVREVARRFRRTYEYRWETFAVRGLRGRQLLHIRKHEIEELVPLTIKDRFEGPGRFKQLSRSSFGPKVLIRSNIAHAKPVIVSWEGRLIAGLKPDGYRLRPGEAGRKG
jgi:hypothetical protein